MQRFCHSVTRRLQTCRWNNTELHKHLLTSFTLNFDTFRHLHSTCAHVTVFIHVSRYKLLLPELTRTMWRLTRRKSLIGQRSTSVSMCSCSTLLLPAPPVPPPAPWWRSSDGYFRAKIIINMEARGDSSCVVLNNNSFKTVSAKYEVSSLAHLKVFALSQLGL